MESCFILFGDSVSFGECMVCEPFLMHSMILLGEEAQVEAWFGLFGDSANLGAR